MNNFQLRNSYRVQLATLPTTVAPLGTLVVTLVGRWVESGGRRYSILDCPQDVAYAIVEASEKELK